MLHRGDTAPDFNVTDIAGKHIKLSEFTDKKILLVFLRYSGCPFCNLAIHRLAMEHHLLQQNDCEIIAFIQSTSENITENIYQRHAKKPAFPIIADPEMMIYKQYSIRQSATAAIRSITKIPFWVHSVRQHGFRQTKIDGKFFLVPGYFLVDGQTLEIIRADYSASFYDHDTFTGVYQNLVFREY